MVHVAWSPAGDKLLVDLDVTNGTPADQSVVELMPNGMVIAQYDGFAHGEWLDADRIALFSVTRDSTAVPRVEFRASDGTALAGAEAFPPLESANVLSSGHGALALLKGTGRQFSYQIWTPDGLSADLSGYPVAWSLDGRDLAVLQVTQAGPGVSGWIEVRSWPDLDRVYEDKTTTVSDEFELNVAFNPSSRLIAYLSDGGIVTADLMSGQRTAWPDSSPWGLFAWTADDKLVVADARSQSVGIYDSDGYRSSDLSVSADHIVGSADGTSMVAYIPRDIPPPVLAVVRNGTVNLVDVPTQLWDPPAFSPDGRFLVAVSDVSGLRTVLIGGV